MSDFTYAVDADGVATITWDTIGKSIASALSGTARFTHRDGQPHAAQG